MFPDDVDADPFLGTWSIVSVDAVDDDDADFLNNCLFFCDRSE